MALTQIGAKIGVEGYSEFNKALKSISTDIKEFQSNIKVLTSEMDGDTKALKNNKQVREELGKTLSSLNEKYNKELEAIELIKKSRKDLGQQFLDGEISLTKYAEAVDKSRENEKAFRIASNETLVQINETKKAISEATKTWSDYGQELKELGNVVEQSISRPIRKFGAESIETAVSFQSAFTGVRKTTNATEEEFATLNSELKDMSLYTASTYETIAGVAEQAGQLNVPVDQIADYTKQVIMLSDATNIDADNGAISIAKFLNIVGDGFETTSQFSSALVALGNNTATDEASILALGLRLASAASLAGMTTPEILGIAAAMSSVGLTAEAGGGAMSKTLTNISMAVANNTDDLELWAKAAGMSASDFANAWRNEPVEALQALFVGLGNLEGGNEELLNTLDELGIKEIRQSDLMRRLTLDNDGLVYAVDLANSAYDENTALVDEAGQRYGTWESQITQAKNALELLKNEIGEKLAPTITIVADAIKDLTAWFINLPEGVQDIIVHIGTFLAVLGPVIKTIGNVIIWADKLKTAMDGLGLIAKLGELGTKLGGLLSQVSSAIGVFAGAHPIIAGIILAITGIIAVCKALGITFDDIKEAFSFLWEVIKFDLELLGEFFSETWEKVKIDFTEAWEAIKEGWGQIITDLSNKWQEFKTNISNKANEIKNNIVNAWNNLKTNVSNIFTNIKNFGVNAFNNLRSGISNTIGNIKNTIVSGFNSAFDFIRNLGSSAWSWGSDLISGFVNGIKSKLSWVTDVVSSVANRVRSYLHFSQPDIGPLSDFNTWMPDMMKGLAKGINDNAYLVDNAINRVADGMTMDGFGGVSYGGVVINLNVPQGANGYQLVDQIESAIANRTIRRKAVFD